MHLEISDVHYQIFAVGNPVEFHYNGQNFSVQEYDDLSGEHRHVWICTNLTTNKQIWRGHCRSTAQCIKIVREILDMR